LKYRAFKPGRRFLAGLPHNEDLIRSIETFCREASVQMATFSLIGSVRSFTIGGYDQKQQVYVTFTEQEPREIIACTGNVSLKDGNPVVHAHIALSDDQGNTLGGHLFSDTILFAGEIDLQELEGSPLGRAYDTKTGLMLWKQATNEGEKNGDKHHKSKRTETQTR